jgi:hypothetical protein
VQWLAGWSCLLQLGYLTCVCAIRLRNLDLFDALRFIDPHRCISRTVGAFCKISRYKQYCFRQVPPDLLETVTVGFWDIAIMARSPSVCQPYIRFLCVDTLSLLMASFRFAVTCNTRSAKLTAEALPFANTSFQLGVYKNLHLVSSMVCPAY